MMNFAPSPPPRSKPWHNTPYPPCIEWRSSLKAKRSGSTNMAGVFLGQRHKYRPPRPFRHSRADGDPGLATTLESHLLVNDWTPACAGVTNKMIESEDTSRPALGPNRTAKN